MTLVSEETLRALRREYAAQALQEEDVDRDPVRQFLRWFDEAVASGIPEANAMTLATVSPDGQPSARTVLLKGFDESGFVFYTNHASRKGEDLRRNAKSALLFFWKELERQVRIQGTAEPVSRAEASEYFQSRPRASQIGAWASRQSMVIDGRGELESRFAAMEEKFEGHPVPLPVFWGGFRIVPEEFEFWQGRPNRLHDRIVYRKTDGVWSVGRLAP